MKVVFGSERINGCFTLRSDENNGNLSTIPEMRHFRVVIIDCVKAGFVLKAKHEYYRIDPGGKLQYNKKIA